MPHSRIFFPETLQTGQTVGLNDQAVKHIQVLRLQPSQTVELFNGNGLAYLARIERMGKHTVDVLVTEQLPAQAPAACRTHLVVSMPANERMDWMIEKATELGVSRIVPVETIRSERGLRQAAGKRIDRWRKIALEASQQSRRAFLPEIEEPVSLTSALAIEAEHRYVLDEECHSGKLESGAQSVAILLGPEGGWTPEERATFGAWTSVTLGPLILRAETAAMAALAIVSQSGWYTGS